RGCVLRGRAAVRRRRRGARFEPAAAPAGLAPARVRPDRRRRVDRQSQPTGGSTAQTPPPDTRAPGRVLGLNAITRTPGKITLRWSNPHAPDLAGIVIRRGFAACPVTASDGVRVGSTGIRTV